MRLTDVITKEILRLLSEEGGSAEIGRNDLANKVGCVPSQVSYVISSRFTKEQGYIVESRRGGGGYIRISRVELPSDGVLMHVVNSVGDALDDQSVHVMIGNLEHGGYLSQNAAQMMLAALSDSVLRMLPQPSRDIVRCAMFKSMLIVQPEEPHKPGSGVKEE